MSSFNSVANPFVYALLMPTYRKCVINTFCPCVTKRTQQEKRPESKDTIQAVISADTSYN